ncbi:MAG: helix-turn-helix transcriptional regulator [Clostridiales bacterium]|nr:helix-turn-helix transcriptional regulator [Clostridiales bacterium]
MSLANEIKRRMKKKDIGNKDLSILTGIPLRTINNILGGITTSPTVENVRLIARALGCTIDDLVYENKNEEHGSYYLNEKAAQMAQELFEREELRVLFDASRHVSKEDIEDVANILEKLKHSKEDD